MRSLAPYLTVVDGKWVEARAAATALGFDAIASLPIVASRPDGVDAGTAGSAIDLRTRMILAAAATDATTTIASLARVPMLSDYPGSSADELNVFHQAFDAALAIVDLNGSEEDLDRAAVLLSWCDAGYRAGPSTVVKGALGRRLRDPASGKDFATRVPDNLIADLAAMRAVGHDQFERWAAELQAGSVYRANPELSGRHIVYGAVPDWLIGSTLIECKAIEPMTPTKLRDALLQLVGYALLDLDDASHIREVAIWLPRRGALRIWSLDLLLGTKAENELPRLRAEFQASFASPKR